MSEPIVDQEAKKDTQSSPSKGVSFFRSDLGKTVIALSFAIIAMIVAWCSMEKRVFE